MYYAVYLDELMIYVRDKYTNAHIVIAIKSREGPGILYTQGYYCKLYSCHHFLGNNVHNSAPTWYYEATHWFGYSCLLSTASINVLITHTKSHVCELWKVWIINSNVNMRNHTNTTHSSEPKGREVNINNNNNKFILIINLL